MSTTLADQVPAKYRANRFSRVHGAFVGGFTSFAQTFVSNCTSQRSIDKCGRLVGSAFLHVQVSIIAMHLFDGSSSGRRWCRFAIGQRHAVQHYSRVFWVGHDFSPVLCNSRSRSRRSYLTPTSCSVQILKRIFCERLVWTRSSASLGPVPCRSYTCTSVKHTAHNPQRIVELHHICRNSAPRGVLP